MDNIPMEEMDSAPVEDLPTVFEFMQGMCDLLGHRTATIWDRYEKHNRDELVTKLRFICNPQQDPSDMDEESDMSRSIEDLASVIWEQRRYSQGILVMLPVYIACVNKKKFKEHGLSITTFDVRPLFRIAKCYDDRRQTENCCAIFVDEFKRVYRNWDDFVNNNMFKSTDVIVAPENGFYHPDENDTVTLQTYREHNRFNLDTTASVVGIGSTATSVLAAAFAAPAVLVGATAAGFACAGYGIGRGISRLVDRKKHEQSIGLEDDESRSVWLGISSSVASLAAGAAMKGVQAAGASGKVLSTTTKIAATGLQVAAITTNGASVANGIYSLFQDREVSYFDFLQMSGSLFVFTHSVYNFQTASNAYNSSQENSLNSMRSELNRAQKRMLNKMLKETDRLNVKTGRADAIRTLRSIENRRDFFQDISKINKKLNKNNIKISFDRSARPVLNNEVPFDSAELRNSLRNTPSNHVFNDLLSSTDGNSNHSFINSTVENASNFSGEGVLSSHHFGTLNSEMFKHIVKIFGKLAFEYVISLVVRYFNNDPQLMHNIGVEFNDRLIYNVLSVLRFWAQQAKQKLDEYLQSTSEKFIYEQLNKLYEYSYVPVILGPIDHLVDECMSIVNVVIDLHSIDDFRERLGNLLHELSPRVVRRLVQMAQMSFGSMIDMGLGSTTFDGFFRDLIEVVVQMARENQFWDLSLYVLVMKHCDLEALNERMKEMFLWVFGGSQNAVSCRYCAGKYSITELTD